MKLYNTTLLRAFLAHLQSQARQAAALRYEFAAHPDARQADMPAVPSALVETWESLSRDLVKVLGPEAQLKKYGELAAAGSFHRVQQIAGRDPFRITLVELKRRADKARLKDPTITLLKSWDVSAKHEPVEHPSYP